MLKREPVTLAQVREDCRFHLYCSPFNPRSRLIAREAQELLPGLEWTDDEKQLNVCERILIVLNQETWSRGRHSDAFAREVSVAMREGLHRFLVHEVPGARLGDHEERRDCPFDDFLDDTGA